MKSAVATNGSEKQRPAGIQASKTLGFGDMSRALHNLENMAEDAFTVANDALKGESVKDLHITAHKVSSPSGDSALRMPLPNATLGPTALEVEKKRAEDILSQSYLTYRGRPGELIIRVVRGRNLVEGDAPAILNRASVALGLSDP